jgi:hypothetical protein
MSGFEYIETDGSPINAWTRGVPIEDAARADLVEIVHTLRQVVCVKG